MEKMLFSGVQSNSEVALIAIKESKTSQESQRKVFGAIAEGKNQRGTDPSVHRTWRE